MMTSMLSAVSGLLVPTPVPLGATFHVAAVQYAPALRAERAEQPNDDLLFPTSTVASLLRDDSKGSLYSGGSADLK